MLPAFLLLTFGCGSGESAVPPSAASPATASSPPAPPPSPAMSFSEAENVVFPEGLPPEAAPCLSETEAGAGIRCLLKTRFASDAAGSDLALDLYDRVGVVIGVIEAHTMDGGWRGELRLVPELPVGQHRRHLLWVHAGFGEIDTFFRDLDARRPPGTHAPFRYRALSVRFFRSVGRTTPSAYANGWELAYNVSGSLFKTEEAVVETLFHEIFHSNDAAHGQWSSTALGPLVAGILERCGQKTACLAPYAPGGTRVRGGTWYAFQEGNGVGEYAAELATRYFQEQRAILRGERFAMSPFKCGPEENARAWEALGREFFGIDLTPPCGQNPVTPEAAQRPGH